MKNQNDMPQAILAEQFGLVYKALYSIEYRDPHYPCRCPCHTPGENRVMHCVPCCYDHSYSKILLYDGVYKHPETESRPSKGNYFLFTDPNLEVQQFRAEYFNRKNETGHTMQEMDSLYRDSIKIKNTEKYVWFSDLSAYTITLFLQGA